MLAYCLEKLFDNGMHSPSDYSPLSPFLPGGYNTILEHSVAQTTVEVLSSDYSPLFPSILQKN